MIYRIIIGDAVYEIAADCYDEAKEIAEECAEYDAIVNP